MIREYEKIENNLSIHMELAIDGTDDCEINTSDGFFDKMLSNMAAEAKFDMRISVEKKANCLEKKLYREVGTALGILIKEHYDKFPEHELIGSSTDIIQDALITAAVNLAGRTYLNYPLEFTVTHIEGISVDSIYEFFYSVVTASSISLHFIEHRGTGRIDNYHLAEASFLSFGKAIKNAFTDAL